MDKMHAWVADIVTCYTCITNYRLIMVGPAISHTTCLPAKRRFLQSWIDEFPWLYKDEKADKSLMFCAWCASDGTPHQLADKKCLLVLGSDGEGKYKKNGLMTHDRSQAHSQRQVEAVRKSKTLKGPMDTVITKMSKENTKVIKHHFNSYAGPF